MASGTKDAHCHGRFHKVAYLAFGAINGTHILISKPSYNPFPKRLLLSLI
jgi:hypothetical protein